MENYNARKITAQVLYEEHVNILEKSMQLDYLVYIISIKSPNN